MMHKFQHEQGGLDTLKTTELPLHIKLSHSGPVSAKKNLTAAVEDFFFFSTPPAMDSHLASALG